MVAGLAAATVITLGAQAVVAYPESHSAPVAAAPVSHPVALTALVQDASLIAQIGVTLIPVTHASAVPAGIDLGTAIALDVPVF